MPSRSLSPRVHSLNVSGELRSVPFAGTNVTTGFFKSPIRGATYVHELGLEGDSQADLTVYGGPEKAVDFYPREHYAKWEKLLGSGPLTPGSFGENITSEGLLEGDLNIGDTLQIGSAILQVLQPRSPCYKLQIRFGRPDMTALFFRRGRPRWYASVLQKGTISPEDPIVLLKRASEEITSADVWRFSAQSKADKTIIKRIANLELLPGCWKDRISRHAGF